ncbi:uncharacterized protein K444DRAFT_620663 [Hyaloscypha bicolor E]|uniref:Uncharacterized protein n=1 Tax=Hyaloscypha bicolor E TaxID=1095630 RepID=A0A2J6SLD2_9HELO|nr:uncharacterized protein K444DRAFT_620663 [Hyaloscypha bicolor E]PMD51578.1 hypothetical protein K444DRAFT_620663 [Hyaloscypha bicolor E]
MFSLLLLLALCSLVVLANPHPRDQNLVRSSYPYQIVSKPHNTPHFEVVPAFLLGEPVKKSQQPRPYTPVQGRPPSHVETVLKEDVPSQVLLKTEDQDVIDEYIGEVDETSPDQSLPCIGTWCKGYLDLIDSCQKGFFKRRTSVPIGSCLEMSPPVEYPNSMMVVKPAICSDGTLAKLAIYKDRSCNSMIINYQLQENDTDLCLATAFLYRFNLVLGVALSSLKPLCRDSAEYNKSLAANASIELFAASTKPIQSVQEGGCAGPFNNVFLPTDTCLSGDYYLSYNMLIAATPACANGQRPWLLFYNARGCVGTTSYVVGVPSYPPPPNVCLWSAYNAPQARYWSMIWRCGYYLPQPPSYPNPQGAQFHQAAIAPPAPCPDAPKSAVVIPCSPCNGSEVGRNEIIVLPTGDCLVTPGDGIEILSHGVCKNGTRAQWARFEDENCGNGNISAKFGLVDVPDRYQAPDPSRHFDQVKYLDKCISTGIEDGVKIRSVAFWCEGLQSGKENYAGNRDSKLDGVPKVETYHFEM